MDPADAKNSTRRTGKGKNKFLDKLEAQHKVRSSSHNLGDSSSYAHKSSANQMQKYHPGAKFSLNQRVMALDRNSKWKLAEVMEIRKEEINSEDEDDATKEESVLS